MSDARTLEDLIAKVEKLAGPDRLTDANILWATNPEAFEADASEDVDPSSPSYCYARGGWTLNRADHNYLDSIPVPPFTASLDAAIALVERCLPGWHFTVASTNTVAGGQPWADIASPAWINDENQNEQVEASAATPAIALCLAALRALANQDEKQ